MKLAQGLNIKMSWPDRGLVGCNISPFNVCYVLLLFLSQLESADLLPFCPPSSVHCIYTSDSPGGGGWLLGSVIHYYFRETFRTQSAVNTTAFILYQGIYWATKLILYCMWSPCSSERRYLRCNFCKSWERLGGIHHRCSGTSSSHLQTLLAHNAHNLQS